MQGLRLTTPLADLLAASPAFEGFTLVDIGCSGGVDVAWRRLGGKLRAVCYDPNKAEIARLAAAETNPAVRYFAGHVGLSENDPFTLKKGLKPDLEDNPWARLSVQRTVDIRTARKDGREPPPPAYSQPPAPLSVTYDHAGRRAPVTELIIAPAHLASIGVTDVDFLKIDVDGKDYEILRSFDAAYDDLSILGVGVEVNFFGRDNDTNNTFHNVDRYMREKGFELMNLSFWRYSLAALPGRYIWGAPAATDFGRIIQGDALYIRDIGNPRLAHAADGWPPQKLLRLALLYAMFNLPDCAAEVIHHCKDSIVEVADPEAILNSLAEQASGAKTTYAEYIALFELDDTSFYLPVHK